MAGGRSKHTRRPAARFASKEALLAGGPDVQAADYRRASVDVTGEAVSVESQHEVNGGRIHARSWTWAATFADNDQSGADETREEYLALMERITMGPRIDVLVFWARSRESRDLALYAILRNHCLDHGVYFWLVGETLYDLRQPQDVLNLNINAVMDEHQRLEMIEAIRRGKRKAAMDGKPTGSIPQFGYRRVYDPRTGRLRGQEPDHDAPKWLEGDDWTPAGLVTWMFEEAAANATLTDLARALNARGVPAPRAFHAAQRGYTGVWKRDGKGRRPKGEPYGSEWREQTIRPMLLNPAYLGHRVYGKDDSGRPVIVQRACWPALIDAETFHAVGELLTDPGRKFNHDQQVKHLLSSVARCGGVPGGESCSRGLSVYLDHGRPKYRCKAGHASISLPVLDQYVTGALVAWLANAAVLDRLSATKASAPQVATARARLAELRAADAELDAEFERADSAMKPTVYARKSAQLAEQIAEVERFLQRASGVPKVVRDFVGPRAAEKWNATDNLIVKRELIRTVMDVRLFWKGRTGLPVPPEDRTEIVWLLDRR